MAKASPGAARAAAWKEIAPRLEASRGEDGAAIPLSVAELALSTGIDPPDLLSAINIKANLSKLVVEPLVDGKATADSTLSLKPPKAKASKAPKAPRPPKVDQAAELAGRLLAVLDSQRLLGDDAYPPTLRKLAEFCGRNASDTLVTKAAAHKHFTERAIVTAKVGPRLALDAPVIVKPDADPLPVAARDALLIYALNVPPSGKAKAVTSASTREELKMRVIPPLRPGFAASLAEGADREDLPEGIGWVLVKGKPLFFLARDIKGRASVTPADVTESESAAPPPAAAQSFSDAFLVAFDRLDHRNGGTNFVRLHELRQALAGVPRDSFDAGLRELRLRGVVSLDSYEGVTGPLPPEDRDAGIREAGSLLVYASRR